MTFKLPPLPYAYDALDRLATVTYPARYGTAGQPRRILARNSPLTKSRLADSLRL